MKLFGFLLMFVCVNTIAEEPSAQQQALQAKFDRCKRGPASQDDLNNLSKMDSATREIYIAGMRQTVHSALNDELRGYICSASITKDYSDFTATVDYVKTQTSDIEFNNLSYAEVAFYVGCSKTKNPFYKNIHPDDLSFTAEGLTETTLEMIRSMGPLLKEKGPNGETALKYVDGLLDYAKQHAPTNVQGVYTRIKNEITFVINELEREERHSRRARLPGALPLPASGPHR